MSAPRKPMYFDYGATTPVDPRVAQQMSACLLVEGAFGNPGSRSHAYGWEADELVEEARSRVAGLIGADPREIVFTSGATESDNLALKGVAAAELRTGGSRRHIVTSQIEHKAVLDTCAYLQTQGFEVTYLAPTPGGEIEPAAVAAALRDDTLIASLMHANNEIGVITNLDAIGRLCRERGVLLHTDAAQSVGKVALDVAATPVDLVSISGHKIYAPKGIGALYVRREPPVAIDAQMHGGGQEFGLRAGTLATHQIVGLGAACAICAAEMEEENARILKLRQRFWSHLKQIPGTCLNGVEEPRLAANLNVGFAGVDGETLMMALDDIAASNGSACNSQSVQPSHVLRAMGLDDHLAHASIRFSLGRYTTAEQVDAAAARIAEVVGVLQRRTATAK